MQLLDNYVHVGATEHLKASMETLLPLFDMAWTSTSYRLSAPSSLSYFLKNLMGHVMMGRGLKAMEGNSSFASGRNFSEAMLDWYAMHRDEVALELIKVGRNSSEVPRRLGA